MPSPPPDVFVSYTHTDRAWAEWIAWVLEEAGYSVAIQAWDSRPGHNFGIFMDQSSRARQTVAVLSPKYLESHFTKPEWMAAFVRDPQGEKRTLIPVRVVDFQPDGLLRPIVYADLVGLDEDAARVTLLSAFQERGKPPTAPAFPGGTRSLGDVNFRARPKPEFPGKSVAISTAKLPVTGGLFVAREAELARLDAAWEHGTNVLGFIAMGGAGKSALVNRWLGRMQKDRWRGAERVLGWSFYSQGPMPWGRQAKRSPSMPSTGSPTPATRQRPRGTAGGHLTSVHGCAYSSVSGVRVGQREGGEESAQARRRLRRCDPGPGRRPRPDPP